MQAIVVYPKEVFHEEHNRVMPIDVPDTGMFPDSQLNSVFRMMNAVDGSAIEKYLRQYCCRSMSVRLCQTGRQMVPLRNGWLE